MHVVVLTCLHYRKKQFCLILNTKSIEFIVVSLSNNKLPLPIHTFDIFRSDIQIVVYTIVIKPVAIDRIDISSINLFY